MLVSTASCGAKWRNLGRGSKTAEVYSSPSKTNSLPLPQAAAEPRSRAVMPRRNPGLRQTVLGSPGKLGRKGEDLGPGVEARRGVPVPLEDDPPPAAPGRR